MNKKQRKSKQNTLKALQIIQRYDGSIRPKLFAHEMWPNSPGWDYARQCGPKGKHKGMGMYCTAGCFLGNLAKRGLLEKVDKEYKLTETATKFITETEQLLAAEGPDEEKKLTVQDGDHIQAGILAGKDEKEKVDADLVDAKVT